MDAAGDSNPRVMWEPNRNRLTKMDRLREMINEQFGVKLGTLIVLSVVILLNTKCNCFGKLFTDTLFYFMFIRQSFKNCQHCFYSLNKVIVLLIRYF